MMEKLTRLQRELRIVKRASWLMGILIAIVVAILAFLTILVQDYPYYVQRFIMNIVLALFASFSICLLSFMALGIVLCIKLHRQRDACRQFLMRLFTARFDSSPGR
jgi:hypothetical protein